MKKRGDVIALFLSLLLVLFPLSIADSWAVSTGAIRNVQISGSDQIPSVTRVTDQRAITAEVKIGDDSSIEPSQLLFNSLPFSSCAPAADGFFVCQYIDIFPQVIPSGQQGVSIKLKDDEGTVLATRAASYMRDDTPPVISAATFSSTELSGGEFNITVNVQDVTQSGFSDLCSGLESIRLYVDNILVDAIPVQNNPCSFSGGLSRSAASLGSPGQKVVCVSARDRFGLETAPAQRKCSTITFDPVGLQIDSGSLLAYEGTKLREFVRTNVAYTLKFTVNITDPDGNIVEASRVRADFRGLGNSLGDRQANSCIAANDIFSCTWTNIPVKLTSETSGTVVITAQDVVGNSAQITATPFSIDDEVPQMTAMQTHNVGEDGSFFLGKTDNQIVAFITESGSGLDASKMRLSSSVFNDKATECFSNGCYWNFSLSGGASGQKIKFTASGTDMAGNLLTGTTEQQFVIDRTDPSFNGTMIFLNQDGRNESFLREEDTLTIIAFVEEEHSSIRAVANLSDATGLEAVEAACQEDFDPFAEPSEESEEPEEESEDTGLWTCLWTDVGPLIADNSARIQLEFIDAAGNKDKESRTLRISEKASSREEFWQGYKVVSQSPEKFSRELVGVAPMSMFMTLDLIPAPKYADAQLTVKAFEPQSCFDELGLVGGMEVVASGVSGNAKKQLVRFDTNPISPLDEDGSPISELEIECSFSVITKLGNKLSSPEILTSNMTVGFYDLPTGILGDNVVEEIERIKEDVGGIEGAIADIKRVVQFVEALCGLISTYTAIIGSLATISDSLKCLDIVSFGSGCATGASIGTKAIYGEGTTQKLWQQVLSWTCAVSSCTVYEKIAGAAWGEAGSKAYEEWMGPNGWLRNPIGRKIGDISTDPKCTKDPKECAQLGYTVHTTTFQNSSGGTQSSEIKLPLNQLQLFNDQQIRASLPLSLMFGCFPGMVDYFVKLRENKCEKALCLRDQVAGGAPIEFCEKRYSYMNCKVVQGNWVALIPFQTLSNTVSTVLAPFASIKQGGLKNVAFIGTSVSSLACMALCQSCGACGGVCTACTALKLYPTLTSMLSTIKPLFTSEYWDAFITPKDQACGRLLGEIEEEPEESEEPEDDAEVAGDDKQ